MSSSCACCQFELFPVACHQFCLQKYYRYLSLSLSLTVYKIQFNCLDCLFPSSFFVYLSQSQQPTKTRATKKNAENLFTTKPSSSLGAGQIGSSCQVLRTGYAISSQSVMNHSSCRHSLRSAELINPLYYK